MFGIEARP